jgi:hypothetical protein
MSGSSVKVCPVHRECTVYLCPVHRYWLSVTYGSSIATIWMSIKCVLEALWGEVCPVHRCEGLNSRAASGQVCPVHRYGRVIRNCRLPHPRTKVCPVHRELTAPQPCLVRRYTTPRRNAVRNLPIFSHRRSYALRVVRAMRECERARFLGRRRALAGS